ncbi:uncharacterized protein V1518DRAFT_416169 [Limtongia smithiae]|uniref:uncharacterized protein n=1 Tax=Limtongia smithiae TaxID=1125753 RepID=UPI0034CD7FD5
MSDDVRNINNSNWRRRPAQPPFQQQQGFQPQNQARQQQVGPISSDGSHGQYTPSQNTPVRGFNSREVEEFLNRGYDKALQEAQSAERAEGKNTKAAVFQTDSKGWSTTKGSVWSQRGHLTAKGSNVLNDLRRGLQHLPNE